jgi:hypothetical protein
LILQTPCLWSKPVAVGDPHKFGATYKARAQRYVQELDKTTQRYLLKWFVKPGTNRFIWPTDPRWGKLGPLLARDMGRPIPWNQQSMLAGAFLRLATCHRILGDAPAVVASYDSVVKASTTWFLSDVRRKQVNGRQVYDWGYVAARQTPEDTGHGAYDVMGMTRAEEHGGHGVVAKDMVPYANTTAYVIYRDTNKFGKRVDGSGDTQTFLAAGWVLLGRYSADVYNRLAPAAVASGRVKSTPVLQASILLVKDGRDRGGFPR